ncbi:MULTISPECIES: hypothetical protein [Virgibacillus]|uniref:Membrane protein n=1 Tax=Virgibacillus pantothenticus TaxID=1473 RepID=A0A0L0QL80_VIRPA|nr:MULTISPECIES: hypothetical protein [Virgibacillus]API91558.1 hypothetical protein BKP57_06730 [Virgibacillus sp. 6R]KNE19274.1 membrane protein [Virgibacillus pantothenticus]MBS7426923.1 hypothetical protein [Virgibacillus sp. 19R1-5]MED3735677.1 hypothetical protein [Virgibacillus pantothenticus]QTY15751.1 hypothetical protein KBP50_18080 [Virgibacillus pantothenticus]
MNQNNKYEKLFWSIALPGFGQILNGRFLKGLLFIALVFLVNVQSNFHQIILLSFHGSIKEAIEKTNYAWLMFSPCLYIFAIWDAWKDAGGGRHPHSFLPFVFTAYWATVGVIYSSEFTLFGLLWGPVWLPILFIIPGLATGFLIKLLLLKYKKIS